MRYSKLFGKTRHNAPVDAKSINAKLLTQAGFIEMVAAGIYSILPLGRRVMHKIDNIIREEMDTVGGQEIIMPVLHPLELWEKTGRNRTMDGVLYRTEAGSKKFVLGPSHEEVVTPLVGNNVKSYKDLPLSVYQIQTKFRNEPRAKSGILRGREFGMKDMYSFHASEDDLDEYYEKVKQAYLNVFTRCGLEAHIIEASGGAFSDKFSHEFSVVTPYGEDTIIICENCHTAQNLEIAEGKVVDPDLKEENELPLKEVDIERGFSVEDNAKAHKVPESKILKTVVYEIEEGGLLGVLIRGDLNISEVKLEKYLKKRLRPASPESLKKAGLVQGYISPVNMPDSVNVSFIADHSIKNVKNFVTGANEYAKDYVNVNIGRDFIVKDFTDLVEVKSGFSCVKCGKPLKELKAVEVGNIFKLGTKFSDAFGFKFADKDGKLKSAVMGCYGIGNTRLLGTVVEASHDDNGIIWPVTVAPYQIHIVTLGNDDKVTKKADELYAELQKECIDVLYDDRDESPGVKFKDSDLIGVPLRIVISGRTLEKDGAEWKERISDKAEIVKFSDLGAKIKKFLKQG
ncbi:MAG: proline--tRNA ligase [Candidatus Peregrinibacteria bacterium]